MKKLIILAFIIFSNVELCHCQDTIPLLYNFQDDIIAGNDDWGHKCIPWNNGILILGNGLIDSTTRRGFSLVYYDTLGNKIWDRVYSNPEYPVLQGNDIISFNDSSFFVGGIIYKETVTPWDKFLTKLDAEGDTVFFKAYIDSASNFLVDMEKYSEDTLLILSAWQADINEEYCKIVIELADTNGNIILSAENASDIKYQDQIIVHNNFIYVGGTKKTSPGSNYHVKVFINRYDMNLNYLGSVTPSWTLNEYFTSLTTLNDNLFLTSGITHYYPPDPRLYYIPNISRLNYLGGIIDTNLFGPASIFNPLVGYTINVGDELLATVMYSSNMEIYFHDANLNPLCNYIVKLPSITLDDASIHDITFVPPDKIAGTGVTYMFSQEDTEDQWNFLTEDIFSFVYSNCIYTGDEEIPETTGLFRVYPTISNSRIFIKKKDNKPEKIILQLFDLNGKLCLAKEFFNETDIDVSPFASGFYLILLSIDGSAESHKIIID